MPTKDALDALVKQAKQRNWAALHNKLDTMYRNDNPICRRLEPWILKTRPPADRFVFERNPYYYRVDKAGHQLPYIDRVDPVDRRQQDHPGQDRRRRKRPAGALSAFRQLHLPEGGRAARTITTCGCGAPARAASSRSIPNLNVIGRDLARAVARRAFPPRAVARDRPPRDQPGDLFRAGDRGAEHAAAAEPALRARNTARPGRSSTSREANRLLDLIGLTKRDGDGIRLLPDGRPIEIIVENSGESTEQVGRARTDPRLLARGRHQAVHQAVAADACSAAGSSPARR